MRISGRDWNKVYCAGTVESDDTVTGEGGRRCPRRKRANLDFVSANINLD